MVMTTDSIKLHNIPVNFAVLAMKEIADELWRRHLIRNDSKIVEIFHGQIKSVMKCLKCEKV